VKGDIEGDMAVVEGSKSEASEIQTPKKSIGWEVWKFSTV